MKIEDSKIFVTGGAGFIGSHIVENLLELGASVTIYDNFSSGTIDNLSHVKNDVDIVKGDILDFQYLQDMMKDHDIVSHHAAQLEIFLAVDDPVRDLAINTIGTLNVLKAAQKNNVRKLINASSACIYGQTSSKTDEGYLPSPNWAYGVSKLAAERYSDIYSRYNDMPVVNLRYAITYGEREWYRRVLTIFIRRAILNEPLVIFGDGQQIRDFIYIEDVVRLHNLCIENDIANGQTYNVGTGIPIKIVDLAYLVSDISQETLGNKPQIIFESTNEGEFSKLVPDKKRNVAELKMMLLDVSKAVRDLKWQPVTTLRDGIKKEIIWASENLHRWRKINYTVSKRMGLNYDFLFRS